VTLAEDGGGLSVDRTLTIEVTPVNDPPSFALVGPETVSLPGHDNANAADSVISVAEDSGPYNAPWATDISAGPDEDQGLSGVIECKFTSDSELFAEVPSLNEDANLTFTPVKDGFGFANCNVTLFETEEGGLSFMKTLLIEVRPVNDAPSVNVTDNSISVARGWPLPPAT
jgi:hypothetical protein